MPDEFEDYDPDVESLLAYIARKTQENIRASATLAKHRRNAPSAIQAEQEHTLTCSDGMPRNARTADINDMLGMAVDMLNKADNVATHIRWLRQVAEHLLHEADRLETRNPVDFHSSDALH